MISPDFMIVKFKNGRSAAIPITVIAEAYANQHQDFKEEDIISSKELKGATIVAVKTEKRYKRAMQTFYGAQDSFLELSKSIPLKEVFYYLRPEADSINLLTWDDVEENGVSFDCGIKQTTEFCLCW